MQEHLTIVVVGGGLAGLLSGIRLANDGHSVTLFERRERLSDRGGGIMIRSNATEHLIKWGMQSDFEVVAETTTATNYRDLMTGNLSGTMVMESFSPFPVWSTTRQAVQTVFYRHAESTPNLSMRFGVEISEVDPDSGRVALDDGSSIQADLIVAADGVHSKLRKQVAGDVTPVRNGRAVYQTWIPMETVKEHPEIGEIAEAGMSVWAEKDRRMISDGGRRTGQLWAEFVVNEGLSEENPERWWEEYGDFNYLRETMQDVDHRVRVYLDVVKSCSRWVLCEVPALPSWRRGKMLLLGDAAHGMFPSGAQGLSMTIEDVAALSLVLQAELDGPDLNAKVERAIETWQDFRKPRVERMQYFARTIMARGPPRPPGVGPPGAGPPGAGPPQPPTTSTGTDPKSKDMNADIFSSEFLRWQNAYDLSDELHRFQEDRRHAQKAV